VTDEARERWREQHRAKRVRDKKWGPTNLALRIKGVRPFQGGGSDTYGGYHGGGSGGDGGGLL
jgi:hypothetical protein